MRLLTILLSVICFESFAQISNSLQSLNIIEDSLDSKLLSEELYRDNIEMDFISEESDFSEYISRGMLHFYTKKNLLFWLDSLNKSFGGQYFGGLTKKNFTLIQKIKYKYFYKHWLKFDTNYIARNVYEWKSKQYLGIKDFRLYLKISKNSKPQNYEVVAYFFDGNNDLLQDTSVINYEKDRIKRLVFQQNKNELIDETPKAFTLGKSKYFSFWYNINPLNFDSVMNNLARDKNIIVNLNNIEATCVIGENGKIRKWKLDFNEDDKSSSNDSNQYILNKEIEKIEKYKSQFIFPEINLETFDRYVVRFTFRDFKRDSINKFNYISNLENLFNSSQEDTTDEEIGEGFFRVFEKQKIGKYSNTKSLLINTNFIVFDLSVDKKWKMVYDVKLKTNDYQCLQWAKLEDINQDGYDDLISSSCPNMNGNMWHDIYLYIPEKDSFLLKEESIHLSDYYSEDTTLIPRKDYLISEYSGSWYMPNIKTVYKWENYQLKTEMIIGTELLFRSMEAGDDPIYFVYKRIDDKIVLVKQINLNGKSKLEPEYEEANLLKPFLEKKITNH